MTDHASQRILIEASPEECFRAVIDVESYPDWIDDIKEATIVALDDDGRAGDATFRSAAMGRSSTYTLRYSYGSNPLRVAWRLLEGDIMRRMDGEYEFSEVEGQPGVSQVHYHLEIDLLVRLPSFVKRRAEAMIVHSAVDDLKSRVESGGKSSENSDAQSPLIT
ncbi:MAG: Uncharacterised protein [Acidimicrobiales bacterium AG-410-I20]|nr:MAG: Uncharacterised protein [Acidimicrobiales bacterium AG-410-I20]